jgi:hypothetical protein
MNELGKYTFAAENAKKQNASMPTAVEMLVRIGCDYEQALELVVAVYGKESEL